MSQTNYKTVPQVVDELRSDYQKVLYMIRTGKLPAEKVGKEYRLPNNYQELMKAPSQVKRKKDHEVQTKKKRGRSPKEKTIVKGRGDRQELLIQNLVKAIQDLVEYQVAELMDKKQ